MFHGFYGPCSHLQAEPGPTNDMGLTGNVASNCRQHLDEFRKTWIENLRFNPSLLFSIVCIRDPNLVITVPADGLAPNGARPSTGTVLTTELQVFCEIYIGDPGHSNWPRKCRDIPWHQHVNTIHTLTYKHLLLLPKFLLHIFPNFS